MITHTFLQNPFPWFNNTLVDGDLAIGQLIQRDHLSDFLYFT